MKNTVQCGVKLLMQENWSLLDILNIISAVYVLYALNFTFIYSLEPRKLLFAALLV